MFCVPRGALISLKETHYGAQNSDSCLLLCEVQDCWPVHGQGLIPTKVRKVSQDLYETQISPFRLTIRMGSFLQVTATISGLLSHFSHRAGGHGSGKYPQSALIERGVGLNVESLARSLGAEETHQPRSLTSSDAA